METSLKVGLFGAELTGPLPLWHKSVLTWMCFSLQLLLRTHLHCEMRFSYPESISKLRKGLKGSHISGLSSICLSSINNPHIKAVVQEQIRKVEFFAQCNSLHLLTFFPFRLSVVLRCLAFRMICNVNYIIVLSHILTSNRMIDYRI